MTSPYILGLRPSIPTSYRTSTAQLYQQVGNNTGNLAFHHAIDLQLGGETKVVDWNAPVDAIDGSGDTAVIPCANQLGTHLNYGGLAAKFGKLQSKMVAIGLGAQSGAEGKIPEVPAGTIEWVRRIVEHSWNGPNISVRGAFSLRVLEHYNLAGSAVVLGCPTLFINPAPDLGHQIELRIREPKRIAVTSGHYRWNHLARIEASLAHMVSATRGSYIGQSPLEMLSLTRGEADSLNAETLAACRDYTCPEMTVDEFVNWTKVHGQVFFDIPAWMEHYRRFDLVIGTRIHGVMLGLQAGIPGVCIAHDSRTLELCQVMQVPHVRASEVAGGIPRSKLMELMTFDGISFDSNRKRLARDYCNFLTSNRLSPAAWLQFIASGAAQ